MTETILNQPGTVSFSDIFNLELPAYGGTARSADSDDAAIILRKKLSDMRAACLRTALPLTGLNFIKALFLGQGVTNAAPDRTERAITGTDGVLNNDALLAFINKNLEKITAPITESPEAWAKRLGDQLNEHRD